MSTWVALLRGINVGGRNRLPMAELRRIAGELGWSDPRTYIQSGNLVFNADGPSIELAEALSGAIADSLGLNVPVMVRSRGALQSAIAACPLPTDVDPKRLYLIALSAPPTPERVAALDPDRSPGDTWAVDGDWLYVSYGHGMSRTRAGLDWFERSLKVSGTARNWRTVGKLLELGR